MAHGSPRWESLRVFGPPSWVGAQHEIIRNKPYITYNEWHWNQVFSFNTTKSLTSFFKIAFFIKWWLKLLINNTTFKIYHLNRSKIEIDHLILFKNSVFFLYSEPTKKHYWFLNMDQRDYIMIMKLDNYTCVEY